MMEDPEKIVARSSSCRGVAFEIKRDKPKSFLIQPPSPPENEGSGRWVWLPWNQNLSFGMFSMSQALERSMSSRPSSHFCDLDFGDGNNSTRLEDLEEFGESLDLEDQKIDEVVVKEQPTKAGKGKKRESRLSILLLDQGLFTVYKRLFVVCLTLNITALILAAIGYFPYAKRKATLFSIGNILALTLCRSEAFLRIIFWLTVKILGRPWVPLHLRTAITSLLQCLGGIHSSCGIASIAWLVYALVLTFKHRSNTSPEIIGIAFTILTLLSISSLAAFPLVRHLHHNVFERAHRFAGWMALALLWVFIILTFCYEPILETYDFSVSKLVKKVELWFTFTITILIILPWITVRRVPVKVSAASNHASIIKFEGGVQSGILGRISPSPLSEWHAFGIISNGQKEHMMLAGAVGDFTKSLVLHPPSHLWVRQVHFAGLPYLVNLYERVVLVATGSGICVFLSFLLQPCSADVCLVWVAKDIEQNFGKEIKEMLSGFPKDKVIVHDTAISGRPNVAHLSVDAAKRWKAQVVIVTSNPEGSRDVVGACKAAGIPAFGPIWDS